jgi:broad specificity phosphatase PhoE
MKMPNTRFRWPLLLVLLLAASPVLRGHDEAPAEVTTVVIVRHAEKAQDDPKDPTLSPAGQARAEALASALDSAGVAAIYSTQYKRNILTAEPLAKRLGLSVIRKPIAGETATYAKELAREVLAKEKGKTVLIVGHSNTVPELVQAFSGSTIAPLSDADYDQIFVVVVQGAGPARLFKTRYGASGAMDRAPVR